MKTNERYICLDTETTGISIRNKHKIIEIGCIEIINGQETGQTYHTYINPNREIDKEAQAIHGITLESLQNELKFNEIAQNLMKFIENSILVIHNAPFDINFLNYELEQCGIDKIENEVIDTLILARKKYAGEKASLDALCKKFEIDSSARTLHGALLDASLLAKVFSKMDQEMDVHLKKIKYIIDEDFIRDDYSKLNFMILEQTL